MTRDDFLSKQADSERRIRWRVIPLGIIYSIRLVSPVCSMILAVLLWIYFGIDARNIILAELVFCVLFFGGSFLAGRDSRRQFAKRGLRCLSCESYLIF